MSNTINLKRFMSLKYNTHSPILINILKAENARNISPDSVIRIFLDKEVRQRSYCCT